MFSDGLRSFLIILIFIILNSTILLKTGTQSVQSDWPNQRCNPIVLPFAGMLSPDGISTSDNFSYCIQNTVSSFSSVITQPYEYATSLNASSISSLNDTATATQQQQTETTKNTAFSTSKIYEVFFNLIIAFNVIIIKLFDSQSKMSGVVVTLMNTITASDNLLNATWNALPGKMLRDTYNLVSKI